MTYFPEDSMKISPLTNKSLSLEIEGRTRKLSPPSRPEQASDEGGSRLDTELVLHEGQLSWMARQLLVL